MAAFQDSRAALMPSRSGVPCLSTSRFARTVVRAAVTTVSPAFSATLDTVVVTGARVSVMAFQEASNGPTMFRWSRQGALLYAAGRAKRALSFELSRAVLSDARSTQFYARVSSGCEQRCLFGSLALAGSSLLQKSSALPCLTAIAASSACQQQSVDCPAAVCRAKRCISEDGGAAKLCKALSAATDASRCGASRVSPLRSECCSRLAASANRR
jgi:hypothetical protein